MSMTQTKKVLALTYGLCQGKAGEWVQPYMRNTLDTRLYKAKKKPRGRTHHSRVNSHDSYSSESDAEEDEDMEKTFFQDPGYLMKDFNEFVTKFKEAWYPTGPGADARNTIERLFQGTLTVSEYASKFNLVAIRTRYLKKDLRERFCRGLNQGISNIISSWDRDMSTLDKLKNVAIKAEHQ